MRKHKLQQRRSFSNTKELLGYHFQNWAELDHVNMGGFGAALSLMNGLPQVIVETGTSAWGTDSTRLWDAYVRAFGGQLWSVDISPAPRRRLARQVGPETHLVVGDSVAFLTEFAAQNPTPVVDLCYLDSWDVDWSDPEPSAEHGLREWHAVAPLMRAGSILMVDDSPSHVDWVPEHLHSAVQAYVRKNGVLPGKAALIHQELKANPSVTTVWHGYNVVYRLGMDFSWP